MTTVVVHRQVPTVVVKAANGVVTQSSQAISLQNQAAVASLGALNDVVLDSSANGGVLQFNSSDNKYHIRPLSIEGSTLDGGSF